MKIKTTIEKKGFIFFFVLLSRTRMYFRIYNAKIFMRSLWIKEMPRIDHTKTHMSTTFTINKKYIHIIK